MSDETWTETHRAVLERALTFEQPETKQLRAIRAALAEIADADAENARLHREIARLTAKRQDVMIGGNHLANALLSLKIDPAALRKSTFDAVLETHGQPAADMWVAWKALMDWRDAVEDQPQKP